MPYIPESNLDYEQKVKKWSELYDYFDKTFNVSKIRANSKAKNAILAQTAVKTANFAKLYGKPRSFDEFEDSKSPSKAPTSIPNPNTAFRKHKARKSAFSGEYPPWDTPGVDIEDIL